VSPAIPLSELLVGDIPLIATSFGDDLADGAVVDALATRLDVAELRIDRYSSAEVEHVVDVVRRFAALPTIATIRTKDQGGGWDGTESERFRLFEAVLPYVDAIDIELTATEIRSELVTAAHASGTGVIISHHDFERTPASATLEDLIGEAKGLGADLVKIAVTAQSSSDVRTLAALTLDNAPLGLIVIAMGTHGVVSRVLFPTLGSRITYAGSALPLVSGQLTFDETYHLMRKFSPEFNERKARASEAQMDAPS
jgi:3-dehydroquinate dehydratase I